jgi:hypothetical protein
MATLDESQAPDQPFLNSSHPAPQTVSKSPPNPLGGLVNVGQSTSKLAINKQQLIAGLHHLHAFQKQFSPLLKSPVLGKGNIRPKIFDAAATLIGEGIFSVPEVVNGIKDLPDDPVDQKKWLEMKLVGASQAEKKLISDYMAQGPGPEETGPEWSADNHREHTGSLVGNYNNYHNNFGSR